MTTEKYLTMCKQLNKEPDPDEMPPEMHHFPEEIQKAILLYNKLGDRVYPDIGYLGKDYTQLPIYLDIYNIKNRELFLETLLRIDSRVIKNSADKMASERKKAENAAKR